jgi:hypothetical protein
MNARRLPCFALAALVGGVLCGNVKGQPAAPETSRFEYRVGGQAFTSFDSVLRLDSTARGTGTELRLEDDVDLEERINVVRADGLYRFNERHQIAFAAYEIDRDGLRRISRDIEFGDESFTLNTFVASAFEQRIAKVSYGWNALVRPRGSVGPTVGLHIMSLAAGLALASEPQLDDANTTAPLPVVGVRGDYWFAPRWRLVGAYEWFDVEVGDARGVFNDFIVSVEHETFDRFGFGAGVNTLGFDVTSRDEDFTGTIDLSFRSFLLYFRGRVGAVHD